MPDAFDVCAISLETEYTLAEPCEAPCTIVDDRNELNPDVQLDDGLVLPPGRCAC